MDYDFSEFNVSEPTREWLNKVEGVFKKQIDAAKGGQALSFKVFYDDVADVFCDFVVLPFENKKEVVTGAPEAIEWPVEIDLSHATEFIPNGDKAAYELVKESWRKYDWFTETEQALDFIQEKDERFGTYLKLSYDEGKTNFEDLKSQEQKDFVMKILKKVYEKREDKMNVEETLNFLKDNFESMTVDQRKDVVKKMSWFVKWYLEYVHSTYGDMASRYRGSSRRAY